MASLRGPGRSDRALNRHTYLYAGLIIQSGALVTALPVDDALRFQPDDLKDNLEPKSCKSAAVAPQI